jgi:hypothetical protein
MRKVLSFVGVGILVASTAYAHHSFSATYDSEKKVDLEGRLVQFAFRNPHAFLTLEAPDDKGGLQKWSIEWSGAGQLASQGVTRETLKPGDRLIVHATRSRVPGEYRALMVNLKRPSDGFTWGTAQGQTVE